MKREMNELFLQSIDAFGKIRFDPGTGDPRIEDLGKVSFCKAALSRNRRILLYYMFLFINFYFIFSVNIDCQRLEM
jgi:hypothetical protein